MLNDIRVIIHTVKGDIEATLYPSKAPLTTANFLNLAARKFYDGLTFHRVVPQFVIQGGDPHGTGSGGPGYKFDNEKNTELSHRSTGVMAMANAGRNTNGSQFYITIASLPQGHVSMLDEGYTIFGQVTKGLEVTNKIAQGDKIQSVDILDPTEDLFAEQSAQLKKWNKTLDQIFGSKLAPAKAGN